MSTETKEAKKLVRKEEIVRAYKAGWNQFFDVRDRKIRDAFNPYHPKKEETLNRKFEKGYLDAQSKGMIRFPAATR